MSETEHPVGDETFGETTAGDGESASAFLSKYPVDEPLTALDAADMRHLFRAAYDWLERHYEQVNNLNVFPVPDGDTGTNLLLTIKSAWAAIKTQGGHTVGSVLDAAAEGAHHGSRGNSGVIFGQMLQGFSQSVAKKAYLTAHDLAEALAHASEAAYAAVPSPVEGTILTVSREMSVAAAAALERTRDLREILRLVVEAADAAVHRTPDLLPALKKAGVVDSGGKGLYYIFEGMHRALMGQGVPGASEPPAPDRPTFDEQMRKGHRAPPPVVWGFDVQYLVEGSNRPLAQVRQEIGAMGECALVEGDERLIKVHVHVRDPGVPLSYGVQLGFVTDVVVENMDDMALAVHRAPLPLVAEVGLVAVAPGAGFEAIFLELGAERVVHGGQTMNPSLADLAEAVRSLAAQTVFLLPNNSNILLTAHQAATLLMEEEPERRVVVLPAQSLPQGIAAALAFDPAASEVDELADSLRSRIALVETGEVTQAVRDAEFDGLRVSTGDIIGLRNGDLAVCGSGVDEVVLDLLAQMNASACDVISLYYGDFVAVEAAQNLAEAVRAVYPETDVEVLYGGQPYYFYILSTE